MNAIVLRDAAVRYPGDRGLAPTTATIASGEVVALIGPSGAGKSTLLDLAAGIIAPTQGEVLTLDQPIASLRGTPYRSARGQIGQLHQRHNLTEGLDVLRNVLMGHLGRWSTARALWSRVRPRAADVRGAAEALAKVELGDRLHAMPHELSGGERQRVALARLIVQAPQIWLADEPTAGLDIRLRRDLIQRLIGLARSTQTTAVVALHDLELLDAGFDRVWGLREGTLTFEDTPAGLDEAQTLALFKGAP